MAVFGVGWVRWAGYGFNHHTGWYESTYLSTGIFKKMNAYRLCVSRNGKIG